MNKKKSVLDLSKLYRGYGKMIVISILGTILISLNELSYPYLTRYVVNDVINMPMDTAIKKLIYVAIIFGGLHLICIVGQYIQIVFTSHMVDLIRARLRNDMFWKLEHLSFKWYDNNRTGEIMSILGSDIDQIDWMSWSLVSDFLNIVISLIGAIVVFSTMNMKLTMLIVPMVPALLIEQAVFVKYIKPRFSDIRELSRSQMKFEEDKIAGIRTVQAFNKEVHEFKKFNSTNEELNKASVKKWKGLFGHRATTGTITSFFFNIVIIVGSLFTLKGEISLSDLLVFNMYSYMIMNPSLALADYVKEFAKCIVSYNKVMDILDTKEDIENYSSMKPKMVGNVQFNDVSFSYNGNDAVLKDCNLRINSGEYVAIVGPSGAGKSTIAGLIPRYYDLDKGSITIDGINIRDINLGYLRRSVGVVQQDIYLFAGTIFDNISYSVEQATMDQVIEAAKLANCHEFISKLPNGYNTDIGERGVKLSGGQKQRIAIARLFLSNPSILIFDEATSALDNESERKVQKALENLARNKTTIVIAHRLSTIINADRILFLSENGIEEEGTHDELMKLGGKYAKLYEISNNNNNETR